MLFVPEATQVWYAPFLEQSITQISLNPWAHWLSTVGGAQEAFPYGLIMWLCFLPATILMTVFGLPISLGYDLTLLAVDFALLVCLRLLLPGRDRLVLLAYWLSPIILVASYCFGLNDLIPSLFLVLSMLALKRHHFAIAGLALSAAVSAKLSMLIALPFFAIYLFKNKALRHQIPSFVRGFVPALLVFLLPHLGGEAGRRMLFNNPELSKVNNLVLELGDGVSVYVILLLYLLLTYLFWRMRRSNFILLNSAICVSLLMIVLLTPASPGWFIWCVPSLVIYLSSHDRSSKIIFVVFSAIYTVGSLLRTPLDMLGGIDFDLQALHQTMPTGTLSLISVFQTLIVTTGILLMLRIWRSATTDNEFSRISRKPFVLSIAGDSGSGKDTLVDALTGLFGSHSCTSLSGDDYHRWDRRTPIWSAITHLNPMANDIDRMANDMVSLGNGKDVYVRQYDHSNGRFTEHLRVRANDFIFLSGLHALHVPIVREVCDLKIFLNMDENLRRYFKIRRDAGVRGHSVDRVLGTLERREIDSRKFIRPQSRFADLVLGLAPANPRDFEGLSADAPMPRLMLHAQTQRAYMDLALYRVLVGVLGLYVDFEIDEDTAMMTTTIDGDPSVEDIGTAARILYQRELELLDTIPAWQPGVLGLMQLVVLAQISQAMTKRIF